MMYMACLHRLEDEVAENRGVMVKALTSAPGGGECLTPLMSTYGAFLAAITVSDNTGARARTHTHTTTCRFILLFFIATLALDGSIPCTCTCTVLRLLRTALCLQTNHILAHIWQGRAGQGASG